MVIKGQRRVRDLQRANLEATSMVGGKNKRGETGSSVQNKTGWFINLIKTINTKQLKGHIPFKKQNKTKKRLLDQAVTVLPEEKGEEKNPCSSATAGQRGYKTKQTNQKKKKREKET